MALLLGFSLVLALAFFIIRFVRRKSLIAHIQGPPSPSWILGHEDVLRHQEQVGDVEFKWFRQYGPVVRTRSVLGDEVLLVADAKALQHILHTSGYRYPKAPLVDRATKDLLGNGLVSVKGMVHQRQRKVLLPGFSLTQLRTFSSLFQQRAKQGAVRLKDLVGKDKKVMNIYGFLGRITLDVIGESAFRYEFNALDDGQDELLEMLKHLFDDVLRETTYTHISNWVWARLPSIFYSFPSINKSKQLRRFLQFQDITKAKAREILSNKSTDDSDFMAGKDILSILVRANDSEDEKKRLDEDEVLAQASTMILAGYETSASTMTWILYELSKRPDQQARIRRELAEAHSRNETLSPQDYDGMKFMSAVIKETLRLHPIVPTLQRVSEFDDVIPLAEPIITTTGESITEITVQKGQAINVAIHYYNRNPYVWGKDADEWNPERFLTMKEKDVNVGVFANLLTFSAGIRGCIGWRFAVMEMQTILVELMDNFEFSLPEGTQINRQPAGLMLPFVKGKMGDGPQMPLCVAPLS